MATRPALSTAILAIALAVVAVPARGEIKQGQQLVVAVHLRVAGNDAVTACQNEPLGKDARPFADGITTALGLTSPSLRSSPNDACVELTERGHLSSPRLRNERTFRLDAAALRTFAQTVGYRDAFLIVCTPLLSQSVHVTQGPKASPAEGCRFGGFGWSVMDPLDVEVRFRATGGDLGRGLLAATSWWVALLTLAIMASLIWGRRYHWRGLRARPWLAWIVAGTAGGLAAYGWSQVAYQSHLVHSLQLLSGIGIPGEALLIAVPAFFSTTVVGLAAIRVGREAARIFPAGGEAIIPDPAHAQPGSPDGVLPYWPAVPRTKGTWWAGIPSLALIAALFIFGLTPRSPEIRIEGMLAAAIAYAFMIPVFASGLLPYAFAARRMEPEREQHIVEALRSMGSRAREVWIASLPPATFPVGGALLRAGRRVLVWEPLTAIGDEELAGAIALRSARKRGWPLALGASMSSLLLLIFGRDLVDVPPAVVLGAIAIILAVAMADIFETIRTRTAAHSGARAEHHVRGLLRAGRVTARLAAGGELGSADVQMPNVAEGIWRRTQKLAAKVADEAGLPPGSDLRLAQEILATETFSPSPPPLLPVPAFLPSPQPIEPAELVEPAEPVEPVPAPAKTTATRKAATRRAPERSGRRPRP